MQEHVRTKVLAQAMRYTPGKLATVRGSRGKSIVEMINFMEENIKSTDCPKINCDKRLFQTRTCKCGELVHRLEYETLQPCENCGGYQSTVTWCCKTHHRVETSSVVAMIQALSEDMDADEEASEEQIMTLSQETADAIEQRHNVIVDVDSGMYTSDDPSHLNGYGATGWQPIPQIWIDEVTT